jgi:hypothetical protein
MASISSGGGLEARLREMAEKLRTGSEVRAGFFKNVTYRDGTSVATVAAVQEFGSPAQNIPPRPFFRSMLAKESKNWGPQLGALIKQDYDAARALETMGQVIKADLQQSIKDTNSPPLAPATIKRKGFAKPLVDTGKMQNNVDYEVQT